MSSSYINRNKDYVHKTIIEISSTLKCAEELFEVEEFKQLEDLEKKLVSNKIYQRYLHAPHNVKCIGEGYTFFGSDSAREVRSQYEQKRKSLELLKERLKKLDKLDILKDIFNINV